MCRPRVAAASWAGMRAAPMAVNCQALGVAPASRAIRRQIKVATEPVMSRSGPMAVARMAARSPAGPAGCRAAAAGRLFRPAASAVPSASWPAKLAGRAMPWASSARIAQYGSGHRAGLARARLAWFCAAGCRRTLRRPGGGFGRRRPPPATAARECPAAGDAAGGGSSAGLTRHPNRAAMAPATRSDSSSRKKCLAPSSSTTSMSRKVARKRGSVVFARRPLSRIG
jgi:hypothetical protein